MEIVKQSYEKIDPDILLEVIEYEKSIRVMSEKMWKVANLCL